MSYWSPLFTGGSGCFAGKDYSGYKAHAFIRQSFSFDKGRGGQSSVRTENELDIIT